MNTTNAALIAALEDAARAINSMKVEAETAAQGDEQMMLEACEQISNEGLAASEAIRAAIASTAAQPPAGWVLVPVEPTKEMIEHAHHACDGTYAGDVYRAMVSAAPKAEPAPAGALAAPAWTNQAVIEYQYTGGTHWCELGPAERMRTDFDGVYRLQAGTFPTQAAPVAQGDALTPAEADQLEKAITDFEECGETDVPDAALQRFAAMGYLECVHYNVLPAAHKAIDAARSQQEGKT